MAAFKLHNREFYETYARLLECAEATEIFHVGSVLDGSKDRFSEKSLKKLDDLDIARAPFSVIGSTRLHDESFLGGRDFNYPSKKKAIIN